MSDADTDLLVFTEPDYICIKRFGYSLKRLLDRYPDGVPDETIALALGVSKEAVEALYQNVVGKLKERLRVLL